MQPEDLSQRFEEGKAKPGPNLRFWPSGDEELGKHQLVNVTTDDGEEGGGGLIVDTLVQSIYHDNARNFGGGQRINDQVLELGYERTLCHGWILVDDPDDVISEFRIPACELVRKRGENIFQLPSIEVIPRAEEAGTEGPGLGDHFGEGLGDGRLSCSRQPVEPEDASFLWTFGPGAVQTSLMDRTGWSRAG